MKATAIVIILILGIGLGVAGVIYGPKYIKPYLPMRADNGTPVEGTVKAKQLEQARLLLTISTSEGAVLATFTEKMAEINLLVDKGDAITLSLKEYSPFVDNPPIRKVMKADVPSTRPIIVLPEAKPEKVEPKGGSGMKEEGGPEHKPAAEPVPEETSAEGNNTES